MTSNDRHASHDSPYRTGQHVPLSQNRNAPLTSVATSAAESRPDLDTLDDDPSKHSIGSNPRSGSGVSSPVRPYSPGMRSLSSRQRRSNEQGNPDGSGVGDIQMQSFHDGAPPPPPVTHSWRKIDRWAEKNYEELFDQLCEGCTQNDVNELEHDLDCSLPLEVRESLQVHDGQERGGLPTGIIFGCMLLDCEEIVQEWKNWRTVNDSFLSVTAITESQPPLKAFAGGEPSSSSSAPSPQPATNPLWRQELLDKQDSQPPRAIQKAYAHPGWIPLARDWGGNNIAIDLAPGPAGKWGQVILFGRDYDCKYVIARSWAAFLAVVADDLTSPKAYVDDDTGELKLRQFKNADPPYIGILRWRVDQRYGRKPPKKRPSSSLGVNTSINGKSTRDSPYASPTPSIEERGRSPHRFPPRGPNASPKTTFGGVSSPLARVTEETSSPVTDNEKKEDALTPKIATVKKESNELLDVTTPVNGSSSKLSEAENNDSSKTSNNNNENHPKATEGETPQPKEKSKTDSAPPTLSTGLDAETMEGMKNIEI